MCGCMSVCVLSVMGVCEWLRVYARMLVLDRVHVQNRNLELMQLRRLQPVAVPVAEAFFVAQRLRALKQEDKANRVYGGGVSWVQRV